MADKEVEAYTAGETDYQRIEKQVQKFYKRRVSYEKLFTAKREFLMNNGTLGDGGPHLQHIHEEMIMDLIDRVEVLEGENLARRLSQLESLLAVSTE